MNQRFVNTRSEKDTRPEKKLPDLIKKYLFQMEEKGRASRTIESHAAMLRYFAEFVRTDRGKESDIFSQDYRKRFYHWCPLKKAPPALNGFIRHLENERLIPVSGPDLPDVYLSYLTYNRRVRQSGEKQTQKICKVLKDFNSFLDTHEIQIQHIDIKIIDMFIGEYNRNYSSETCLANRSIIRQFMRYLYFDKGILKKDLSALIISPPRFTRDNPPQFFRPEEIKKLFAAVDLQGRSGLRDHAILWLAYSTGMRPSEIARITLDDLSFKAGELTLPLRKGGNPVTFPLPEDALKAISIYVIRSRPETHERNLFLHFDPPYAPLCSRMISQTIRGLMQKAGVPGRPYQLRHTFAQNLLESGASIFEIKEMLGHDCIKNTKRYLHVGIRLMREVLLDD